MLNKFIFEDRESLFSALALACERHLHKAVSQQGAASLLVSGGGTPAPLYQLLSQSDLEWNKIHVALVDERWVEKEHAASNEALIEKSLLVNNAAASQFTGMKTTDETAVNGCEITENLYQLLPRPFNVTVLGMGNDGHTASLFPHAEGLTEALQEDNTCLTAPIMATQSEVTGENVERLSLSLHGLLQSERLILLLTGDAKMEVLNTAQADGPVEDMPVRAILKQDKVPVDVYWAP